MTTILNAGVLFLLTVSQLFLWGLFLRWGLRWAKVAPVSTKQLVVATLIWLVLQIVILVVSRQFWSVDQSLAMDFWPSIAVVVATCLLIARVFDTTFGQAFRAWLLTLIPMSAYAAILVLVVRPCVLEAFTMPTNSMAPTLVGRHWVSVCPTCGKPCYRTPDDPNDYYRGKEVEPMICEAFHIHEVAEPEQKVIPSDRIIVSKYLRPQRWDMVVFRYPEDPSILYVKRLVGLPGETIVIKDGFAWANGGKLIPPDELQGLRYFDVIPDIRMTLSGTEESPAVLGNGEYFMLGDFTARSRDARLWQEGFPGHPPYAVPESEIVGVVTHTYWPPERWRTFR